MSAIHSTVEGRDGALSFALELKGISKSFGAVKANQNIDLQVMPGTIHGIVGENGAGKSTLMNIIYGLQTADAGEIHILGRNVSIRSSADAIVNGVGMVHQHFMLVPTMTVLDNVMLGSEGGFLLDEGRDETLQSLQKLTDEYGMGIDPDAVIEDLPVGLRQRVEIIKAIKGGAKILILDEPTGVLTPGEAENLFDILRTLRADGVTVLLITHKLDEIMDVTDAVSVMRDGRMVDHVKTDATNPEELAKLMVGREVLLRVDRGTANPGEPVLNVKNLQCVSKDGKPLLQDVSFSLNAGEILGVAGVSGNGQTELLEVLSGMRAPGSGSVEMLNETVSAQNPLTPDELRKRGITHIPEDRHHHGLVLEFEARENAILGYHRDKEYGSGLLFDPGRITDHCERLMETHDVRPRNPKLPARNFSGGNQQKLVIGREVDKQPKILLVGQPTRGVDIGAIEFIHRELISLRDQGCAILLVSVELEEIMGLSNRIMVMNAGQIVGIVERDAVDEQQIGLMMAGIGEEAA